MQGWRFKLLIFCQEYNTLSVELNSSSLPPKIFNNFFLNLQDEKLEKLDLTSPIT